MPTDSDNIANDQRIWNTALGTALGPIGPALGKITEVGVDWYKNFTKKGGVDSILEPIRQYVTRGQSDAATKAAKELGVFVTPAEVSKSGELIKRESSLVLKNADETRLQKDLLDREEALEGSIIGLVNKLELDESQQKLLVEGYTAIKNAKFSPKLIQKIETDDVLGDLWKAFQRDKASSVKLKEARKRYGEDTLYTLDLFQRYVSKRSKKLKEPGEAQDLDLARIYDNRLYGSQAGEEAASYGLVNVLEEAIPEYKVARKLAAYKKAHENIYDRLSKIKGTVRGADGKLRPSAVQIYDELLSTNKKMDQFIRQLDGIPDAQIKSQQLKVVLGTIKNSPLSKIFKTEDAATQAGGGAFGKEGAALQAILAALKGNFNKGILDYITDPRWSNDILEEAADATIELNLKDPTALTRWATNLAQTVNRSILAAQGGTGYQEGEVGVNREELQ